MLNPRWMVGGLACIAAGSIAGLFWPNPTRLTFLNVGQGDCAVFQTHGSTIIIDTGPADARSDAGSKIVVPKLREMGISGIDLILLSHPDMDHIGGTGAILHEYPSATLAVSSFFRHNHQLLEQLAKWGRRAEDVKWLGSELRGKIGEFNIRVECPPITENEETNDGSMIVRIADGEGSAVFTGDAPTKVEEEVEPLGDWHAEIMKAGHHGSHTATSQSWIESVRPEFAVISCGRNNRYGHPHKEVIDRLMEDKVQICRTDREGDIVFTFKNGLYVRD